MSFLVLKFNELTKIIYLFVALTGLFFGLIQLINYLCGGNLGVIQSLTPSITATLFILGLLLRKVTIKHRLLTHLIGKPIIHGLWKGKLISNFEVDGQKLLIYAELSGDFPLGDSRQPTYKSLRPFDLVS
ncbi:hypothetical protein [Acinetobacter genomosp. 15BJ]|uniref:PH domain-containing protein n=1 Tax=Acinetobacter genomosp. 15BJ TaxID=106651 RepID=A0ABT8V6G6_9GAMM|nr:hypothetical protein [Acinetobacter genomosp. 15BJ]MDO3659210.1 hypothetical protein [Acinetobacter genomosp. 15BJ]